MSDKDRKANKPFSSIDSTNTDVHTIFWLLAVTVISLTIAIALVIHLFSWVNEDLSTGIAPAHPNYPSLFSDNECINLFTSSLCEAFLPIIQVNIYHRIQTQSTLSYASRKTL
jgi:hypothetical protein